MPFNTRRVVTEPDAYLVQVTYTVERRQIVTIPEKGNGKKLLAEAEKSMRDTIIREVMKELHLEAKGGEVLVRK